VRRGDLVTVAVSGDYGKPRPALIVQDDMFANLPSVTALRLTSDLYDWPEFRITVRPTAANGLKAVSQIMLDKAVSVPHEKVGKVIGRLDEATMQAVNRGLVVFLGLGKNVR
jgi:mRNA interferase MazF